MLAFAAPAAAADDAQADITAIVRVDCRVRDIDPAPHRLVGYVFTPTGVVRVTREYGEASSGTFTVMRELAPLETSAFDHLVARVATPRFYAPHAYRDVGRSARFSDRRLAVRRSATTAQFAIEEPVATADRQFSYDAEIALENVVAGLRDVAWTAVTGGFDPFVLCRVPRSSLGTIVPAKAPGG